MSAEAINVVTTAIQERLTAALLAMQPHGSSTVFVGPLDDDAAAKAALVLFLFRTVPNQSLRNSEHRVAAPGGQAELVHQNALALDLHYLLTVGPRTQVAEGESMRVLGYALQALNDAPILAGAVVGGATVRLSLDMPGPDDMSRIWALFPALNYRTSVLYLASPVWIDPAVPQTQAPGVSSQQLRAGEALA